jgi:hypothetical protein
MLQKVSKQRSERRIAVRLPLRISGRDNRGITFEENTSSQNLCQSGAAFSTRFDLSIGCDVEIRIPFSPRRDDADFSTNGRVVHVELSDVAGEKIIGVRFVGPRFRRMFRSESAA